LAKKAGDPIFFPFSFSWFDINSVRWISVIREIRCQFHQHFTHTCFVWQCFFCQKCNERKALLFFGAKISYEKCMSKMLMKLTVALYNNWRSNLFFSVKIIYSFFMRISKNTKLREVCTNTVFPCCSRGFLSWESLNREYCNSGPVVCINLCFSLWHLTARK